MKNFILLLAAFLFIGLSSCSKESGLELDTTGKSGSITRFVAYQGFMYALNLNEVQTYSLENPDKPQLVHRLATDYGLETIIVYEGTVYLGSTTALYVLDISTPATPKILAQTERPDIFQGGCDPVVVKGNYAYSTIKIVQNRCGNIGAESALLVYDLSDKSNPKQVGMYFLSEPNGLGYKDNVLFVCDEGADQVILFDISNPENLTQLNQALPLQDPVDLIVDGSRMIVSARTGFVFYDLSALPDVRKIGEISK